MNFFNIIGKHNLNLTISSDWVLPIIEASINLLHESYQCEKSTNILYSSTRAEYSGETIVGFKEPIITSYNKFDVITHDICKYVEKGSNAIVMGDLLADLCITQSLELDTVISIGYYNTTLNEDLETFKKSYDVTILNDGDLSYATKLIEEICT